MASGERYDKTVQLMQPSFKRVKEPQRETQSPVAVKEEVRCHVKLIADLHENDQHNSGGRPSEIEYKRRLTIPSIPTQSSSLRRSWNWSFGSPQCIVGATFKISRTAFGMS